MIDEMCVWEGVNGVEEGEGLLCVCLNISI